MGKVYTAECNHCNRIYNYDTGISKLYDSKTLTDVRSDFNLLTLFKEKKRREELLNILKSNKYVLVNGYGHKIFICDTCKQLYSRFYFKLENTDFNTKFETKYLCHKCRKKLRMLTDEEIITKEFECYYCKGKIKFHESGEWN